MPGKSFSPEPVAIRMRSASTASAGGVAFACDRSERHSMRSGDQSPGLDVIDLVLAQQKAHAFGELVGGFAAACDHALEIDANLVRFRSRVRELRRESDSIVSAELSKALEGIHPQLRQTPPGRSRSITATRILSWLARIAATYPPGPEPITTRS